MYHNVIYQCNKTNTAIWLSWEITGNNVTPNMFFKGLEKTDNYAFSNFVNDLKKDKRFSFNPIGGSDKHTYVTYVFPGTNDLDFQRRTFPKEHLDAIKQNYTPEVVAQTHVAIQRMNETTERFGGA